jgi:transposase-like protein
MTIDKLRPESTTLRSSKYLNNLIEQDHRNLKARLNVMLGFKRFRTAATSISGSNLHFRHRVDASHSQRPIQADEAAPQRYHCALSVDGGPFSSLR